MKWHTLDVEGGHVQVSIRHDGKILWVNVNGACVLRVSRAESIEVEDARPGTGDEDEGAV